MIICINRSGLANRIKALVSCIKYAEESNISFYYYWQVIDSYSGYNRHIFNCPLKKLFDNNIEYTENLNLSEIDKILSGHNKYTPVDYNYKKIYYHPVLLNFKWDNDFNKDYYKKISLIKDDYLKYFEYLIPTLELQTKINEFSKKFDENTISVHIRSWSRANEKSRQIRLFQNGLQRFENEMEKHNGKKFFLSTDSSHVKDYFLNKSKLKDRVICYNRETNLDISRDIPEGIQEDLIELYLLSKNKTIIGTYNSTFTEVAWWLGGCTKNITIL